MKAKQSTLLGRIAVLASFMCLAGCGGGTGSGGSSSGGSSPPPPTLSITTASILPGALDDHAYSTTLVATGGQGALTWSIAQISPTTLFVEGLSIDASTGVLSGTVKFQGTGGFTAQVTDSASHTASQSFSITASPTLQAAAPQTFTLGEFLDPSIGFPGNTVVTGGVAPLSFTLTSQCLPAGVRMDNASGRISGSAIAIGTFPCGVTVQDSFSPPEVVTGQFTLNVTPPPLAVANSLPQNMLLNRPFSGRVIATGGIPPYHFSISSGSLPSGLGSVDPSGGQISGTPTTLGSYNLSVNVQDSNSPVQTAAANFCITVTRPIGRNDTPATATPIDNGETDASISPYIDPPDNAPLAGDNDYYKLVSVGGSTVHVETQAQRWWPGDPIDTVIEIVDANNARYSSCRQPGDTSTTFASVCVNDDITTSPPVLDSALDFQVPGAANKALTFFIHVLDWKGNARPDMRYALQVSGVVAPLSIQSSPLLPAARGLSYSQPLTSANGTGNITWSVISGSLPPGLSIASGAITGMATTDGTYSFTLQATDSGNPAQTATAQESIQVGEPVKISTSPNLPDACLDQPYSFTFHSSGGIPPLYWGFSGYGVGINFDPSTATFSGVPNAIGTFTDFLGVTDATTHGDSQQITYTVKQCP